jgi:CubicO group peptidase (beta-lactamase class C family)
VTITVSALALAACGSQAPEASRGTRGVAPTSTTTAATATTSVPGPTPPATSSADPAVPRTFAPDAFDGADASLEERIRAAGLPGGVLRVVAADGSLIHEHSVGAVSASTPLSMASSSKWLTAATFMTFVDRGAIRLDDDISRWLPEFGGSSPPITARELLDHTSGVHDYACQSDGTALAACVRTLASSPREFPAGSAFSYGNSPFLVVGRLVEVLGNSDFASVVQQQLADPVGMDDVTWPGAPSAANPAFGANVTVDDYGKFLDMILHLGVAHGMRVLSADAVVQMISNQVSDYETSHDYSVGITQIPRYGLGCWPDEVDGSGITLVASGNGGKGFYPWVDFTTHTWGIVGVQDERGAQFAVPASQVVEVEARRVVDR